jgi:hypothetical protein
VTTPDATAAAPFLPVGRAEGPAAGPEVRPEPPAAEPGDRLPATLEGWQARFPELGPLRFGVLEDVLPGRAPTDVLTPRERSEFGLGLVRFFVRHYEPSLEDPDGEVLAILAAVEPYLAGIDAKTWPVLAFDANVGPCLASFDPGDDEDEPPPRPRRRLGRWTPVRGYKVPAGTPAQMERAQDLKADRWGGLVAALHAELDEPEAALSRFVDTVKKGFPPEAAALRRDCELALTLETLDERDAKFWIERQSFSDDFVVREAWNETMSRIGRRHMTPAHWQAEIERCQRVLPKSPADRAEPDPPPEMARRRILRALAGYPAGETERVIARRIGSTPTETKQFLDRMVARGEVEVVTVARPRAKNQAPGGYRLVGPASAPVGGGGGEGEPHDDGGGAEPGRSAGSPPPGSTAIPDSIETSTPGDAMSTNRNSTPMPTSPTEHDQPPTPDRRLTPSPLKGIRSMNESQTSSDRDRNSAAAEQHRLRQAEEFVEASHAVEADEEARAEATAEPSAETQVVTEKVRAWDVLQDHPIARTLDTETQLALVCEYIDLREDLQGMSLADFIGASHALDAGETDEVEPEAADDTTEPGDCGDGDSPEIERPASLVGHRVVYRLPGRNVLADEAGVTRDSGGTVAFTDVDGEAWSNVAREKVFVINPKNRREIHISRREAREIEGWLAGKPSTKQPEGDVLRSLTVEFANFPDKIVLAIVNGKPPYVDRFVLLPEQRFEDDQKPTTRLFGEHCFRVRGTDHIVNVVSP